MKKRADAPASFSPLDRPTAYGYSSAPPFTPGKLGYRRAVSADYFSATLLK